MNEVDSYFINKQYYNKVKTKKEEKKYKKKDLKFYKKRIYELIKNILENKEKDEELSSYLDIFIKESIERFKQDDKTSILQEEHKKEKEIEIEKIKTKKELIKEDLITKVEEGNREMFKQLNPKSQNIEVCFGLKRKKKEKELILPKQKELNIKDPKFRKKKEKNNKK
jgi:hypothetical protein